MALVMTLAPPSPLVLDAPDGGAAWWAPEGPPNGRAALVLHGYGQAREAVAPTAAALARAGFAVLVPDLPGHGTHPGMLAPDLALGFAARCLAWLRAEGHVRVVGVGFSLGARLLQGAALEGACFVSPPVLGGLPWTPATFRRALPPRAVREASSWLGLLEILTALEGQRPPAYPLRILRGERDLPQVLAAGPALGDPAPHVLPGCDHAAAVAHPDLPRLIAGALAAIPEPSAP